MATIQEVLKATGLTDEQIAALDSKVVTGLAQWGDGVMTTAQQAKEAAELKERQIRDVIGKEINPALNNWENEKAAYAAREAAYQKAFEAAKAGGFVPPEINISLPSPTSDPNAAPQRGADGRYVANANAVPGSPNFEQFQEKVGTVIGTIADLQWKYQTLFGTMMPDSPTKLLMEAEKQHMTPVEYAAKKYNFAAKEQEVAAKRDQDKEAALTKSIEAKVRQEYAEKNGSNGMIRPAAPSEYSQVQKAVAAGTRPDPIKQTPAERARTTRDLIAKEWKENESQVQ